MFIVLCFIGGGGGKYKWTLEVCSTTTKMRMLKQEG